MTFDDVAAFARAHAVCGGFTPVTSAPAGGGYLLTVACACGAKLDRWVTAEEATQPIGRAAAPPTSPTIASQVAGPHDTAAASDRRATGPPPETALPRQLFRPPAPRPGSVTTAGRPKPPATATELLVSPGRAVDPVLPPVRRSRLRLVAALGGLLVIGAAAWFVLDAVSEPTPPPSLTAPPRSALDLVSRETSALGLGEVLQGLRRLQSASSGSIDYAAYVNSVLFAKSDVDEYLQSDAPAPLRQAMREALQLHLLAAAAWRARNDGGGDRWEAIGNDPALTLCPDAARLVDFAEPTATESRAAARGRAVAAAIPLLWHCAARRLADLEPKPPPG